MLKSLSMALCVTIMAAVAAGAYVYWPSLTALVRPTPAGAITANPKPSSGLTPGNVQFAPAVILDLPAAIDQELVQAEFTGNGRERMRGTITNKSGQHVRLHVPAGLIFQNATSSVVILRSRDFDLKAGELKEEDFQTAATSSTNQIIDASFSLTQLSEIKLFPLLNYLQKHLEFSQPAVQTATLALVENLPVSAFAKFAGTGADMPSKYDTSAFKVEVSDMISCLSILRTIGTPDEQLALTIDPQLKIEAMIDPMTHASAMRYYGITPQNEWDFWKHHLLQGEPSTRHYALYGIARFYPDIALQMLPMWVREGKTELIYRISAVQALAETQRQEAIPILRQLEHEFGMLTEIGRAAHNVANVLDVRLNRISESKVAFHASQDLQQLAAQ